MWDFFEQPWTLLGAAVIVLLGVLTFRSVWPEKRKPWQWLLPIGVAVLGVGLDFAVATDLEKINGVIRAGIRAVEAEDCAAIARLIAEDYEDSYHKSKRSFLDRCRTRLAPPAVEKIRKIGKEVKVTSPEATVNFTMMMKFEKGSYWAQAYKPTALVSVQLYFRKQPNGTWLLTRAEVREVDKMPVTWGVTKGPTIDPALSGLNS